MVGCCYHLFSSLPNINLRHSLISTLMIPQDSHSLALRDCLQMGPRTFVRGHPLLSDGSQRYRTSTRNSSKRISPHLQRLHSFDRRRDSGDAKLPTRCRASNARLLPPQTSPFSGCSCNRLTEPTNTFILPANEEHNTTLRNGAMGNNPTENGTSRPLRPPCLNAKAADLSITSGPVEDEDSRVVTSYSFWSISCSGRFEPPSRTPRSLHGPRQKVEHHVLRLLPGLYHLRVTERDGQETPAKDKFMSVRVSLLPVGAYRHLVGAQDGIGRRELMI